MKITRENYEAWLLDHLEGRLSAEEEATLRAFLEEHPELDIDPNLDAEDARLSPPKEAPEAGFDFTELLAADEAPPVLAEQICEWMDAGLPPELSEGMSEQEQAQWSALCRLRLQNPKLPNENWSQLSVANYLSSPEEWLAAVAEGDVKGILADHARKDPRSSESLRHLEAVRLKADAKVTYPGKAALLQQAAAARTPVIALVARFSAVAAMLALVFSFGYYFLSERPSSAARGSFTALQLQERTKTEEGNEAVELSELSTESQSPVSFTSQDLESGKEGSQKAALSPSDLGRSTDRMPMLAKREAVLPKEVLERSDALAIKLQTTEENLTGVETALYADAPASAREGEYMGLDTYLKVKTQEKLLKQEARPEEPLSRSLRDRAVALMNERIDGELALRNEQESKFKLRLGRFSVER